MTHVSESLVAYRVPRHLRRSVSARVGHHSLMKEKGVSERVSVGGSEGRRGRSGETPIVINN